MTEKRVRDDVLNNENGTEISERTRAKLTIGDIMQIDHIVDKDTTAVKEIDKRGFALMNELGKGGFGVVKRALWTRKNKEELAVAIKVITLEKFEEDGKKGKAKGTRLTDAKEEIEHMEKLKSHPYIITLLDFFAVNDEVIIVMELADAKSLMDLVKNKSSKELKESKIGRWFWELTDAVNFMHAKGIAHRDLKLDNVLLKKPEDKGHRSCRLTDLGLSREVFKQDTGVKLFAGHAGTRPYMAPEILAYHVDREHAVKYNPFQCDIWALGVCLFVLLTRDYPFRKVETLTDLDYMKENGAKVKRITNYSCRELIQSMLEPIPAKRITTRSIIFHEWTVSNKGK